MPIYEYQCAECGRGEEHYVKRADAPAPICQVCGIDLVRLFSRFAVVFTGPITARYNDPKRENAHQEGVWAYRKLTSLSGQPEAVFLPDWQSLRDFNKAEGLSAPGEVPTHCTISPDGRRILSDGMPGQWRGALPGIPARLQEIIDKPIEEFKSPGITCTPSMPADYGVKPEVTVMPEGVV